MATGERSHLVLGVQLTREFQLRFQLEDGNSVERFEQGLHADPYKHFKDLFKHVEGIHTGKNPDEEQRKRIRREIEGLGAHLAARILPKRLVERLLTYDDPAREPDESAPTLFVISDEPWIPWDLLRLQDSKGEGPFLAEAFALSRWLWDLPAPLALPLKRIGLIAPPGYGLSGVAAEREVLNALEQKDVREIEEVEGFNALLDGFASGRFTGWHFAGHGRAKEQNPDLWEIILSKGGETLKAAHLAAPGCDLTEQRPLVFLNACCSARGDLALSGLGGLAQAFLEAGAGAVLGTHWSVVDRNAFYFAKVFYELFLQGEPIAQAFRRARLRFREKFPDDSDWPAYTLFAHPHATVHGADELIPPRRREEKFLEVPQHAWHPDRSPPGALLRAEYGVVPFHSREKELDDLFAWCAQEQTVHVRLYTGPGGMGKTRLSLELCRQLREQGWSAGFIQSAADVAPEEAAQSLIASGGPLLMVVDYAETRRDLLLPLLRELLRAPEEKGPFRLILLSRWREDWWEQLKTSPDQIGDLIAGPATSHHALAPLALSTEEREVTYLQAAQAFAAKLERSVPEDLPEDLEAAYFEPVLMLHMSALGAVEGVPLKGEDGILDWILDRERKFWRTQLAARGLHQGLIRGIGRAMSAATLAGGTVDEAGTVRLLEALKIFKGQSVTTLTEVAHLMHDTYPGDLWIMPVQPDILGEHLVERELVDNPQEIFDLVLGPQAEESSTEAEV